MSKKQIVVITSIVGILIVAAGGSWFAWHAHQQKLLSARTAAVMAAAAAAPTNSLQATHGDSISLNETSQPSTTDASGLQVSNGSGGTNLGQLDPNSNSGTVNGGTATSSAAKDPVDPTKFTQYDKYKDGSDALYGDITAGNGDTLGMGNTAYVSYKGWLTNGSLFDQSKTDSSGKIQAFSFVMGQHQVIAGWEEALSGMKVGGTRLIVVPPAVGYGVNGQGSIPGNAVLVFEVQLLAVKN